MAKREDVEATIKKVFTQTHVNHVDDADDIVIIGKALHAYKKLLEMSKGSDDMPAKIWAGTTLNEKTCGGWFKEPSGGYREETAYYRPRALLEEIEG